MRRLRRKRLLYQHGRAGKLPSLVPVAVTALAPMQTAARQTCYMLRPAPVSRSARLYLTLSRLTSGEFQGEPPLTFHERLVGKSV